MSDITELESRITTALERIDTGVDSIVESATVAQAGLAEVSAEISVEAPADTSVSDALQASLGAAQEALEAEKSANGQLEERVRSLNTQKAEVETTSDERRGKITLLREQMSKRENDVQRLKLVNEQLRDSNSALRKANEAGVGDAHLINKAMLAELEALRATRVADMGEMETIMDAIKPMIGTAKEGA